MVGAIPYDVNYLWRVGSEQVEHDELEPPLPQRAIDLLHREVRKAGAPVVVEKTVSNCLRIAAVQQAFPDAVFVFLVRDGVDVTESAARQWEAPVDLRYSLRKAAQFPWFAAGGYGLRRIVDLLRRQRDESLPVWGPHYAGISDDLASDSVIEVCAKQWARSNQLAIEGFDAAGIKPLVIRYETLVNDPIGTVNHAFAHAGLDPISALSTRTSKSEVGKGSRALPSDSHATAAAIVAPAQSMIEEWISPHD